MVFLACLSLQPCSPFPHYLQHRVPKALAVPRGVALCPTLTTQGQLCAALGSPFPPPAVLEPLSNTRQAALRTINTVINREPPVPWHCCSSRRCSRGPGAPARLCFSQAPPAWAGAGASLAVTKSALSHRSTRCWGQGVAVLDGALTAAGKSGCVQLYCPSCWLNAEPGRGLGLQSPPQSWWEPHSQGCGTGGRCQAGVSQSP